MQMNSTLLAAAMLMAASPAFALDITVTGTGSTSVVADLFATSLTLETPQFATSVEADAAIAANIAKLRKTFEKLGLEHRTNFTLANPYTNTVYERETWRPLGYRGSAYVTLEVPFSHPKVDAIEALLPSLKTKHAGSAVSPAAMRKAKLEASMLMAEDAREQAEAIAASIGCKLGSVKTVEATADEGYTYSRMRSAARGIISDTEAAGRTREVKQSAKFAYLCN